MSTDKSLYKLLSGIFDMPRSPTGKKEQYSWSDIFNAIDDFESWLLSTKTDFSIKKEYSNEHIAEQVFINNDFTKLTCKYHIIAISNSISILKKELQLAKDNNYPVEMDYIKGKLALIRDILLDAYELVANCENHFLSKPPAFNLYRNRLFTSNDIFNSSKQLLRRHFYYVDNTFSSASVFLIRQAIETKILNSLGILSILDSNKTPVKFRLESLVEFITNNEHIEFPVQKSLLLKITKWTNIYIHRGLMQYHWLIILAHEILQPLFSMGVGNTITHIHGAVKINKDYFENNLHEDILKCLNFSNCEINKLDSGIEAIIE